MTIEVEGGRVTVQGKATKAGGKRKGKATTSVPAPTEATTGGTPDVAAPAPSRRRKKAMPVEVAPTEPPGLNAITHGHDAKLPEEPPEPTLADLAAGYIAYLEMSGKSAGTVFSYRLELTVAMDELGKNTPVRELTAKRVKAFFESERVTRTRSGRSKSPLSVAKTRRVLAQAIGWGVEQSFVDASVAPVG